MRDHTKLKAFEMADEVSIISISSNLSISQEELYGLDFSNEAVSGFGSFQHRGGLRT